MLTDEILKQRFDKGVERISARVPDWYKRVDAKTLNMKSIYHCVLGKLGETYYDGKRLVLEDSENGWDFGFDLKMSESDQHHEFYPKLTALWVAEIESRHIRETSIIS